MLEIIPDYYPQFSCIGGGCSHNCCIGWEIDIDEDSAAYYASLGGTLGRKLRESIVTEDGCTHFRLTESGRCPFLNESGLCELILTLGEESLCRICGDHPRFYSEWSDRTETGLGLCCPEAARLILTRSAPMTLLIADDDGEDGALTGTERELLALRGSLLALLQDRSRSIPERLRAVLAQVGAQQPSSDLTAWAAFYRALERMDTAWDAVLERMPRACAVHEGDASFAVAQEQLAVYLLYRHFSGAAEDGGIAPRTALAAHAVTLLSALAEDTAQLVGLARLYSAEIEYSEENLAALLLRLGGQT